MRMVRAALLAGGLAALPTAAWAQATTTSTSAPTTSTTTAAPTTTTTVTRVEDLVCSEPVNQVATCVDPQGRVVTRIDEPSRTTTTLAPFAPPPPHGDRAATPEEQAALQTRTASPAQPSRAATLALTG